MMMIDDGWFEILVRVDPSYIFNCIMICKACLEVITSAEFQQSYRKRWKTNSKLVGFVRSSVNCVSFKMLAASELGRNIEANRSKSQEGLFLSKSGAGDGVLLYGVLPYKLYVSKPGEDPVQLPRIDPNMVIPSCTGRELKCNWVTAAILSQNNCFKVIMLAVHDDRHDNIYTFSSSTGKWDNSKPQAYHYFGLFPYQHPGIVSSSRGLVYWPHRDGENRTWVGVYNDKNQESPVTWLGPYDKDDDVFIHGVEVCSHGDDVYDEYVDDKGMVWKRLQSSASAPTPGTYDGSAAVRTVDQIFVYDQFNNLKLDESSPLLKEEEEEESTRYDLEEYVPFTMADLGVWPSSPLSNVVSAETMFIHRIKHLLDLK